MKDFIVAAIVKIIYMLVGALVLFLAWNNVVPELFHYQNITFVQSLWIACAVRVLIYK